MVARQAAAAPETGPAAGTAVARALGGAAVADPFAAARDSLAAGASPASRLEAFRRAGRLIEEGWRSYLAVDKNFARDRLGEARRVAEEVVDLEGGRELLAEVSLRLGVVLLDLGDAGEAAGLFRLARALDPAREVGVAEFHPDVVRAIQVALAARVPRQRIGIQVEGEGDRPAAIADAVVEVDGGPVGQAPVDVELAIGQHLVVVRRPGFAPRGQLIAVRAGDATPVTVVLERDPGAAAVLVGDEALAVGRSDADARVAVDGLLVWGELDAVLLTASVWRRGQPALLGQLCRGVPVRCTGVEEVGYPPGALDAAARQLVGRLRAAGLRSFTPYLLIDRRLVAGEPAPGTAVGGGEQRRWWRNPYLLVGVGAAAVAAGALVLFGRDSEITPIVGVDRCDFVACD